MADVNLLRQLPITVIPEADIEHENAIQALCFLDDDDGCANDDLGAGSGAKPGT